MLMLMLAVAAGYTSCRKAEEEKVGSPLEGTQWQVEEVEGAEKNPGGIAHFSFNLFKLRNQQKTSYRLVFTNFYKNAGGIFTRAQLIDSGKTQPWEERGGYLYATRGGYLFVLQVLSSGRSGAGCQLYDELAQIGANANWRLPVMKFHMSGQNLEISSLEMKNFERGLQLLEELYKELLNDGSDKISQQSIILSLRRAMTRVKNDPEFKQLVEEHLQEGRWNVKLSRVAE